MISTIVGTALNLLGEIDFAEGTQKPLKTNIYGASVRDKMDASMGYNPYATQTNRIERRMHVSSGGGTFNKSTDSTVVLQKGQMDYNGLAHKEQDKNKNDWLSGTLKTVGGLIGGIDVGGLLGDKSSNTGSIQKMESLPAGEVNLKTTLGAPGEAKYEYPDLSPRMPSQASFQDVAGVDQIQSLPSYTAPGIQAPILDQNVPYKQTSTGTPLAENGVKTSTIPNMQIVSWRKIRDGNYAKETVPIHMSDGTKVLAKKGEIEVSLRDNNGKESKAVLNTDQWRSYLSGNDINDILSNMPTTEEANVAAGGNVDPETQFKAEEIADLGTEKDKYLKELEAYYKTTQNANAAKNIVNVGGSLAGIVYNLKNKEKYTPLEPYMPSVAPVHLQRPDFSEQQTSLDRAFLSLLQSSRENGNTGIAPAILSQYTAGLNQLGELEANERGKVANTEAGMNAQIATGMEQMRSYSVQRTNEYNKEKEIDMEKARREKDEKTYKMLQDMFNSPITLAALNAKGKYDMANAKWGAEQDYYDKINGIIASK